MKLFSPPIDSCYLISIFQSVFSSEIKLGCQIPEQQKWKGSWEGVEKKFWSLLKKNVCVLEVQALYKGAECDNNENGEDDDEDNDAADDNKITIIMMIIK